MSDVLRFGKKIFTVSVVAMTIAWSVGLAALVPAGVSAATVAVGDVEAGDLIKLADQSAVYLVNENMERMYFAFGWLYKTWFPDFTGIKTLAAGTDFDEHFPPATRGAVSVRPGSCELLKSTESPAVYATSFDGVRHRIGSEATAIALCGASWASHVHDVPAFVIGLFPMGAELDGTMPFPGQLVRVGTGPVYVVGSDSKAYAVEGTLPAFLASEVRTVATLPATGTGSWTVASLTSDVAQLPAGSGSNNDNTSTSTATGDLTVSLAGNTADADVVPGGAQNVEYLSVVLKATSGDVDVESLTFHRSGVGDKDDFNKIYVYHNGVRLDNGRTLNSDDEVTFNVNLTIDSGSSETLVLKADMDTLGAGDAVNGDQNRFEIRTKADVEASGDVAGSFPVRGNLMAVGAQDLGEVTVTAGGTNATAKIGQNNVKVAEFDVEGDEDITVTSITLQQKGSIELSALSNLVLKESGKTVAEGVVVGDDKVQFELESARDADAGDTVTYRLYADVGVTDVDDTIQFILDEESDLNVWSQDNAGYEVTVSNTDLDAAGAFEVTVAGGKISVDFDGENASVRADQNDASFGVFTILATAEDLDVNKLYFTLQVDGVDDVGQDALEDIKLREKNGHGVYSLDVEAGQLVAEDLTLTKGVKYEFEVLADVPADATDESYSFDWAAADVDATGSDSDNDVVENDFSSSVLTGPAMDVENSSLVARSSALADKTVVNGTKNVLVYRGTLEAGDTSDVTLSSMTFVAGTGDEAGASWEDLMDGLKLYVAANNATIDPNTTEALATYNDISADEATFDGFEYTVKGGSVNRVKVEVYADIAGGDVSGDIRISLDGIDAIDVDNEDVQAEDSAGADLDTLDSDRLVTVDGTGSISMEVDNDYVSLKNDRLALAGTPNFLAGRIKVSADNEDIRIQDLAIDFAGDANSDDIGSVSVYSDVSLSDASLLASTEWNASTTFEGINYVATAGATKYLYVAVDLNTVGEEGTATAGNNFSFVVGLSADQVVKGVSSKEELDAEVDRTVFSNDVEITPVKIALTNTLANGVLQGNNQVLFSFKVSAESGENTDESGDTLKALLQQMDVVLTTNVGTADNENVSNLEICREGGDCVELVMSGDPLSATNTSANLYTDADGEDYIDFTLLDGTDSQVLDEAVFFIRGDVLIEEDNTSLQIKITDLDAGGFQYGVDFEGDDDAVDYTVDNLKKDAPRGTDYPSLTGGSLKG